MITHRLNVEMLQRVAVLTVANVIIGVGVPLIVEWITPVQLDPLQGAIIAMLVILILTTVEALARIEQVYAIRRRESDLWTQRSGVDATTADIQAGLHQLITDDELQDSFYLDHYNKELQQLRSRIQATILTKEIYLDRHHIDSTKVLLSIYNSPKHAEFRATHVLADITDVFDVTYQVYFFDWLELLRAKKVRALRRLFLYENLEQFNHQNARKLIAFHNSSVPGLEARAISMVEVRRFMADYRIVNPSFDFGVFSDQYIYLGQVRRDENISGRFSRDKSQIRMYTSVFDGLWNSRSAFPVAKFVSVAIDEFQLFDGSFVLDDAAGKKPNKNL